MKLVPRRIPRTEIPQGPVPLDLSWPLAQRAIVAVTPTFAATPGNVVPLVTGASPIGASPPGPALTGGAGALLRASVPPVTLLGRTSGATGDKRDFTVAFVVSDVANGAWLADRQGGGSSPGVADIQKDGSGNLIVNTGSGNLFSGQAFPSTARVIIISMGTYLDSGTYIKPRVWFDAVGTDGLGSFGSPNQDSYGTITVGDNTFFGSSAFPSDNYFLGKGALAVVFRGNFTDADAAEFTSAYARMFEPEVVWEAVYALAASGTLGAVESGSDAAAIDGTVLASGTLVAVETGSDVAALVGLAIATGTMVAVETEASDVADFFGGTVITSTGTMVVVEAGGDTASFNGASDVSTVALAVWGYTLPNGQRAEDAFVTLYSLLFELHQIHGLRFGFPLTASSAGRSTGTIEQTIDSDGTTTTLTRV